MNEAAIYGAQMFISKQVKKIKEIEKKLHERLSVVTSIVTSGANIIYAKDIAKDLGKYQALMIKYAREDPELIVIAYETEAVLVARTADLLVYLASALTGTDLNLLDNKQRMEIIEYVVNELRIMRGIAHGISNKMEMASKTDVLDYLNPFHLAYPDQGKVILKNILSDI